MILAAILIFLGNAMLTVALLQFRRMLEQWTAALLRSARSNEILQRSNVHLALKLFAISHHQNHDTDN